MSGQVATYSRKGFLYTATFAAIVTAVRGLVAFLSAPEHVACSRRDGVVGCTLTRALAGRLPVRTVEVVDLGSLRVETYREESGIGRRTTYGRESHRLRFVAASGIAFGVHAPAGELAALRDDVEELLAGTAAPGDLAATLSGTPRAHRWSLGFLAFGLSLVPLWVLGYFFPALRPAAGRSDR